MFVSPLVYGEKVADNNHPNLLSDNVLSKWLFLRLSMGVEEWAYEVFICYTPKWTDFIAIIDNLFNTMKADRTPEEAGLKLLIKPKAPPSVPPIVHLREDPKHPVWIPFLN